MLKNPCDFLINRISVIVQRRRYKGRRKGWKSSEIRIEGRGIDSWKRSLHFVRSVHIESKSRRTIKADVSIWTCRDFLFFPLFSAFILPLPLFLWFHSPLPYSLLPSLFFYFSSISSSFSRYTPREYLSWTPQFFARIPTISRFGSFSSRVCSTLPSENRRLQFYSFTTLAPW